MKTMIKVSVIFLFFTVFSACATAPMSLPKKYDLNKELKQVDQITTFQLSSWEVVDNQSIILETTWHKYYLLVLDRPISGIIPTLTIGISSTVSSITAGSDRIFVNDGGIINYYIIEKIYELKDRKQVDEIKKQLGGK